MKKQELKKLIRECINESNNDKLNKIVSGGWDSVNRIKNIITNKIKK